MDHETGELPVEPPAPADGGDGAGETPAGGRSFEELLVFHLYGRRRDDGRGVTGDPPPVPALLGAYRGLSRIRHDYPVVLDERDAAHPCRPLKDVIDGIVAAEGREGDDGEQFKHNLYRLESAVKSIVEGNGDARLSTLWERAAGRMLSTGDVPEKKKSLLAEHLSAARAALQADGDVISCDERAPERLFRAVMEAQWHERCADWLPELDALIRRLENVLEADFSGTPEARRPERLRESLGAPDEELDVRAMSTILSATPQGGALSDARRERVRTVLSTLRRARPLFDPGWPADAAEPPPFDVTAVVTECAEARDRYDTEMSTMVELFKSVGIARLEVENRYRESRHDGFFGEFSVEHLTDDEWALCPPVLLCLRQTELSEADTVGLLELLGSGMPVKVLFRIDDLCDSGGRSAAAGITPAWAGRLAVMAMAGGGAYVLQAPVSRPRLLAAGFTAGFRYAGPALFSVYSGLAGKEGRLSPYLAAEAAVESRAFPILSFDPAGGNTLAARLSVRENPQSERSWSTEPFRYVTADGQDAEAELAFTPADFLYCDPRFAGDFWDVPKEKWGDGMVSVTDYFDSSSEDAEPKIPYIVAVDRNGRLVRSVPTRPVMAYVARCAESWRQVQEFGGIDNSFAADLLAAEKERLAEEQRRQVEDIERNYVAQLDHDLGELTREIVQRIASQLIAEQGNGAGAATPMASVLPAASRATDPPAVPAAEAAGTPPEAPPAEELEADDDALSLESAYIDTPLCTSCNECTNLNAAVFAYDDNKQAFIRDAAAGPYRDLVRAAELCPVHIIHPGAPVRADEAGVEEWIERATPFN